MISDLYIMEKQDLRTVPEPAREELRKRGIRMLGIGKRKKEVAEVLGVNKNRVTDRGKVEFMICSDRMNSERPITFLKQLIKGRERKIFLILDDLRVHHSGPVKEWAEKHRDRIELFYLPSYSPEKNPDEYLNCDLKNGLSHRPDPKNAEPLHENLLNHMTMLQSSPERVSGYFKHPHIAYLA